MPGASILLRQYQGDLGTPSIGLKGSGYCVERGELSAVVLGSVTNKHKNPRLGVSLNARA